jgi:hypothetical protein
MDLNSNFKNLFWTQFSKLRNRIGFFKMSVRDTTCILSFVKIGSGIQMFIGGSDTQW